MGKVKHIWLIEEIDYLIEHYEKMTNGQLRDVLKKPRYTIANKLNELGLKRSEKISNAQIAGLWYKMEKRYLWEKPKPNQRLKTIIKNRSK
jgi:hypothetical protein